MKNVIFCGFGKLGTECLKILLAQGYNIKQVMTHKELKQESVDTFAIQNDLDYSYEDFREDTQKLRLEIINFKLDYLISINYRYIIPKEIFEVPKYAINIHGSLLPKYRGRTPHVWSIINGEEYSGITCHIINENVDSGNIISQKKIKIEPEDTGYTLLKKFQLEYPNLLIESLNKLENGYKGINQDEAKASYYGKRISEMGYINFYERASQIINFVRAQSYPYPGAYGYLVDGKKIIINKIEICDMGIEFDSIGVIRYLDGSYYVKCIDNILKLIDFNIIL